MRALWVKVLRVRGVCRRMAPARDRVLRELQLRRAGWCHVPPGSTYGVVLKARHKETGQIVAIKKIKESDKDEKIRQNTVREVRILKVSTWRDSRVAGVPAV